MGRYYTCLPACYLHYATDEERKELVLYLQDMTNAPAYVKIYVKISTLITGYSARL